MSKLDERIFLPGCQNETEKILELITQAAKNAKLSEGTFCHRILGDHNLVNRIRLGRVTVRKLTTIKWNLEKEVEDLEK